MPYDSYYMTFRKGKTSETVNRSVLARGLRRVRGCCISTGDCYGGETIRYDTVMLDTYHYTVIKIHKMYNTKIVPYYKSWTSVNNIFVHQL